MLQRGIDGKRQVEFGVDERAVQIKDQAPDSRELV
jgi:hypothetical protein